MRISDWSSDVCSTDLMHRDRNGARAIETDVPARLERLPWSRFHWLVVTALGVTWILDGLEVTLGGCSAGDLRDSPGLRFSATEEDGSEGGWAEGGQVG